MEPNRGTELDEVIDEQDIKELIEMTRENNEILHGMRRRERIGNILKVFYIGFIIVSVYGAYVFIEPYVRQAKGFLESAQKTQSSFQTTVDGVGSALGVDPAALKLITDFTKGFATTTQR
jgi:hypothetical protein